MQLIQGGLEVDGIPQHDNIEHQAECAQLIFLTFPVMLAQLAAFAMEHRAGDAMAAFTAVELNQRTPALGFVVDVSISYLELPYGRDF